MAFTESTLAAAIDPNADNREIIIERFIPGAVFTDVYAVGVITPYGGRSRWVKVDSTLTAAQAATAIQAALA